jgi:CRISPR-associated protein Cas2
MDHTLLLTYDITDDKIRHSVHKYLKNYGSNTQKSVFEITVSDIEYRKLVDFLLSILPHDFSDTVRIYELCKSCFRNVTKVGEGLILKHKEYEII